MRRRRRRVATTEIIGTKLNMNLNWKRIYGSMWGRRSMHPFQGQTHETTVSWILNKETLDYPSHSFLRYLPDRLLLGNDQSKVATSGRQVLLVQHSLCRRRHAQKGHIGISSSDARSRGLIHGQERVSCRTSPLGLSTLVESPGWGSPTGILFSTIDNDNDDNDFHGPHHHEARCPWSGSTSPNQQTTTTAAITGKSPQTTRRQGSTSRRNHHHRPTCCCCRDCQYPWNAVGVPLSKTMPEMLSVSPAKLLAVHWVSIQSKPSSRPAAMLCPNHVYGDSTKGQTSNQSISTQRLGLYL